MTSLRKKGTPGRIALGRALGTALILTPTAALTATAAAAEPSASEPSASGTSASETPVPRAVTPDTQVLVVPDEAAYAFLGEPGARVWDIEEPADAAGLTLTGVEGPGALVIHRGGEGTAPELVARSDGAEGLPEDGYPIPPRDAAAADIAVPPASRWAFTAPGTYGLTLADSPATEPVRRTTTLTVRVGAPALATPTPTRTPTPTPMPAAAAPTAPALAVTRAAAPASTRARAATQKKVLQEGHVDIAARVVDGKLQIQVKDGTVAGKTTWREPSSVELHVRPAAKKQIPAGNAFSFLGKSGEPVWLLDQVQQEGLLWPGWSTDNVEAGALKGGVKFALTKAEGPGSFALYTYDGLSGANVLFNSRDGVPDTIDVPANTHAHGGWAFGGEGVHRLTVSMTGTLANGSASTDTETLTFVVGDGTDPGSVAPSDGASGNPSGNPSGSGGASSGTGDKPDSAGGDPAEDRKSTSGSMADTGAGDVALMGAAAVALAAAGATLVVLNRRRGQRNGVRA
ncbi:TIGR03773 family transporter-associated surface protein [Streptomyces sp. SKN60]|uniref:TIGR03773 family transporter-associated surface protein n=1 Tax=Streptomyces sp. SKN60 TaxID=2855506 RepID=UPI002246AA25|nr:TIGR03773 family transporter-associated surface protein [Streptomyces sp. SKN60]MCX2180783.1 TIGR03773 family transporter-associated surface protein [Streptomyces sp. SKN60]